ncbi:MAG: response regulator [Patescibacteria group bacterium]
MSKKLLIVDDNWGCSDLYRMRFEFAKWEVKIAYSAEDAIEMFKDKEYLPDAILLDLMLPKMQGDELLKIIRKDPRIKDIVVVVLTALNLNPIDQNRISGDADDYIMKIDILPEQLVNRINELVEKKAK